jgi:hypothetical protein
MIGTISGYYLCSIPDKRIISDLQAVLQTIQAELNNSRDSNARLEANLNAANATAARLETNLSAANATVARLKEISDAFGDACQLDPQISKLCNKRRGDR